MNKGAWSKQEDQKLIDYINKHGEVCWRTLPQAAGLLRCGKSCRLRWINYLRPDLKRGNFAEDEEDLIIKLHALLGNRWSLIAGRLPGRTDNEVKNYWNSHIKRKLISKGIDPNNHRLISHKKIIPPPMSDCSKSSSGGLLKTNNNNKSNVENYGYQVVSSDEDESNNNNNNNNALLLPDLNLDLTISIPSSSSSSAVNKNLKSTIHHQHESNSSRRERNLLAANNSPTLLLFQ
ncbi:hypothetical protein PIB30_079012 [Stylosanthes scabra]|uniref:Uncharacterized protein n=1 Tax=Stylosanthes scabra TaxID=79078 RepID=A0ABU6YSE8_9FABA|nr:hypothetical protein [Stylosanthes scabra]